MTPLFGALVGARSDGEHGIAIGVVEWTATEPLVEVDTAEDLELARRAVRATNTVSSGTD